MTAGSLRPATIAIEQDRIASVGPWQDGSAGAGVRDFGDLVILPGLVDTHVHINDPGRADWEGFDSATRAAAAGGITTLVDMPLNCVPETINAEALAAKRSAARGHVWVDWATWGGLVGGGAAELGGLMRSGVRGFKCFLIHSGIDGFAWVDEEDLRAGLEQLRGTGLPLLAHAELAGPVESATSALNAQGSDWRRYATYLGSRPDAAEVEAIALLVRLAESYRVPIHIVHLASAEPLPLLKEARARGVPITVETTPHYLWFSAERIPDGATAFKCAPPIRGQDTREALWNALTKGVIDLVASDHSPCPPAMKRLEEGRWDLAWGGISSLGLALPLVWTESHRRGLPIERVSQWLAEAPARLAGLAGQKGDIIRGADADLVIFDTDPEWTVAPDALRFRHKLSPYLGAEVRGRVVETWLRGRRVFAESELVGEPSGRELVRS
jgi:allantoinase